MTESTATLAERRYVAPPPTERRYVVPLALVTSLFFLWAIGVNLNDILIPHLKKALDLTDFQSSLIQTAFFGGYFLMALPAGRLMRPSAPCSFNPPRPRDGIRSFCSRCS